MYIAICDDLPEELYSIASLLEQWQETRRVPLRFKSFRNAFDLIDAAQKERFTLYLLDVMMPGTNGLEAAKQIRLFDEAADIAFLTTSPGFAYESYSVRASEYLLKPVSTKLLFPFLDRLSLREQRPNEALSIKSQGTFMRIPFEMLVYVEVYGKHLYFNLSDGSVHKVSGTLSEYEPMLLSRREFVHCHRSYIVNLFQVKSLSAGGIVTLAGKALPVSRTQYPQLQKEYMALLFSK